MRIRIVTVGKPRDRQISALHDRYAERIRKLGIHYDSVWVPEVPRGGRFSDEHALEREARLLEERLRTDARGTVVALDRRGRLMDSRELSRRLESWATPRATFVIGGPLGIHERVLESVDARWSLSPLTFPHELSRVLLAEQLYRAATILRGPPYHK